MTTVPFPALGHDQEEPDQPIFVGTLLDLERWVTDQPTRTIANVHVVVTVAPPASDGSPPARSGAGRGVVTDRAFDETAEAAPST